MNGYLKMARLDFLTIKPQLTSFLALLPTFLIFGAMGSPFVVMSFMGSASTALMAINIFDVQEKNRFDRFYGSVPINSSDIVLGRYFFIICSFFIAFTIIILLHAVFTFFQSRAFGLSEFMLGFSLAFLAFAFIIGITFPLFFKMGFTKAKLWSLLPLTTVAATMLLFGYFSTRIQPLHEIIERLQSNQGVLIAGSLAAGCCILLISYRLSVVAYRKRRCL